MSGNVINHAIEIGLPYIIGVLELMGIFIVCWSGIKAFWQYIRNTFFHKNYDMQFIFAQGLATALEFKMAAEILKTVIVRELSELMVLGAIIVLRALVTILLRFEIRAAKKRRNDDVKPTVKEVIMEEFLPSSKSK